MAEISLPENPRILVTRADRIGDLVLSTPVFPELRKRFPSAYIAALTFTENRQVLEGNPYLDEVILYDKKGAQKNFSGVLAFASQISKKKFDVVIHLHATNRMHLMSQLARIPVRVGWNRRMAWALTHAFDDVKKEGKKHEVEYNFDLLAPLGISSPEKPELYFPVPENKEEKIRELIKARGISADRPLIVFSPSASCPSKRWPAERFGRLADLLAVKRPAWFAAIGTPADQPLIKKIQDQAKVRVEDFSGQFNLAELGAFLKSAVLLVTNDSGPAHIAAAVGTPVVSVFGRRQPGLSPKRWRPLGDQSRFVWKDVGCDPCLAHECQIHFLCLDVISEEDVLSAIETVDGSRRERFVE